jgi:hypothetical protein
MKNLLSLAAVAGILAATFAPAAHAEAFVARYTYLVNGGLGAGGILNQSAIVDNGLGYGGLGCGAALPAVIDNGCGVAAVGATAPIMVQDHENIVPHFFHLGVWPLVDFSIF